MPIFKYFTLTLCLASMLYTCTECSDETTPCPNVDDIKPCTCRYFAFGLNIVCANFNSSDSLTHAFKILRGLKIHTFLLHGMFIDKRLPSDLFAGMNIQEIRIEKSKLNFSEPAFMGLDSSLCVLNVAQQSKVQSSIAKLTKLNELYVQFNKIHRVDNSWLNNRLPNVHTIVLDNNDIDALEDLAFNSLRQLKNISLAENGIKHVLRSMFPGSDNQLCRMDFSFNVISHLPEDFFTDMPKLREVILSGNDLVTLPENTWKPVWKSLNMLLIVQNKINCNGTLDWIRETHYPSRFSGTCYNSKTNKQEKEIKSVYKIKTD